MPLSELQSCAGNYHVITNTNVVANNPPTGDNKGRYYFYSNSKHTLFSQKNKDKSNDVTKGFLDIISGWRSTRLTPAFSTRATYSRFSTPAFSTPAFSVVAAECE